MSVTIMVADGDLAVSVAGRFVYINGIQKCAQDIAESLLNNWDPIEESWYNGSELYAIDEDPSTLTTLTVEERIRSAVDESIERLRDLQDEDDYVDDDELIDEVRELWASKLGNFTYGFYLRVITSSYEEVPMGFTVSLGQQLPPGLDELDLQAFVTPSSMAEPYA